MPILNGMPIPSFAVVVCFLAWTLCLPAGEPLVFDDDALGEMFSKKLGTIAQNGDSLDIQSAVAELDATAGKRIPLPRCDGPGPITDIASLYTQCVPAVVAIGSVYKCEKCSDWHQEGFATGWIVSEEGLVMTNAHVFEGDEKEVLGVITHDGRVFPIKEVLAADKSGDAAVFRIATEGASLPCLKFADSAAPGEEVTVISHPSGRLFSLTSGKISRFHRQHTEEGESTTWMSVTADFAVGSSGGPVLNAQGEVVGMVSSTLTAYSEESADTSPASDVQMVFKDCVPLAVLRGLFEP